MADIAVVGAGYVGLVTAACFAELGNRVTGVEANPERLGELQAGRSPVLERDLPEMLGRNISAGRLRFTGTCRAVHGAELVFIAVHTPAGDDGRTETRFVEAAVRSASRHLSPRAALVIKSTVPPGTADGFARETGRTVLSNPEFLCQGTAVADFMRPDRIVVGAPSAADAAPLVDLYAELEAPVLVTSRRSAEMSKYAANSFLAMRISFVNEIAELCEAAGADIEEVAGVLGGDGRIGPAFLRAGIGWGGSCFPKDVSALRHVATVLDCPHALLDAAWSANQRQRDRALAHLLAATDGADGASVAVLGLAFKPETDDVRGSPALEIIGRLLEQGLEVRAHDPAAVRNARRVLPNITYCASPYEAVTGADALLLVTEWPEYQALDWPRVASLMRGRVVIDGRNALDGGHLAANGFNYRGFGRLAHEAKGGSWNGHKDSGQPVEAGHSAKSAGGGNGRLQSEVQDVPRKVPADAGAADIVDGLPLVQAAPGRSAGPEGGDLAGAGRAADGPGHLRNDRLLQEPRDSMRLQL
jgi:UDPglucose 6-dehydrogenase